MRGKQLIPCFFGDDLTSTSFEMAPCIPRINIHVVKDLAKHNVHCFANDLNVGKNGVNLRVKMET